MGKRIDAGKSHGSWLIIKLKTEIGTKIGIVQDTKEKETFILALKLISTSEKGKITKEGICLWENTINQQ